MQRESFTERKVRQYAAPGKGRTYYHDAKTPHLALCVTAAGARTYYRVGRIGGKPQRMRLGTVEELTVDAARRACAEITGRVAAGHDPHTQRRQDSRTLGDLWAWYFVNHSKPHKDTWLQDERRWQRVWSQWSSRRLTSIRTEDVQAVVTSTGMANGPYAGNKARELLRHMFGVAVTLGWVDRNPVTAVKRFRVHERERYLLPEEVGRFFLALEESPLHFRDYMLLCLFTGARRGSVAAMRKDQLDLQTGVWSIPGRAVKNDTPTVVVLAEAAVEILRRRVLTTGDSPFIFPSRSSRGHYRWPKSAWATLVRKAKLEDVRIHDLRRTLGSWQANAMTPLNIIGKSLGHKSLASTQIYARLQLDPVRAAVEAATAALLAAAEDGRKKS